MSDTTKRGLRTHEDLLEARIRNRDSEPGRMVLDLASDATLTFESVRKQLTDAIATAKRRLAQTEELIAGNFHVDSCGVLQSLGVEIDRLCGEYGRTATAAGHAQRLATKMGCLPE